MNIRHISVTLHAENYIYNTLFIQFMTIFNLIPAISMPSGWEWIIILVVVLLLFGGKKIPELMRGIGKGVRSFKEGLNEAKEEINKTDEKEESKGKKD